HRASLAVCNAAGGRRGISLEGSHDIDQSISCNIYIGVAEITLQLHPGPASEDRRGAGSASDRNIVTTIPGSGTNDYGVASACASRAVAPCCCARIGSKY